MNVDHQRNVNFDKIKEIVQSYGTKKENLIVILQKVQEEYRYLSEEILIFLANLLNISPAKVYGVATFFSHFTLDPKGKYVIRICDGTACHVKKSDGLLEVLQKELQLKKDQGTTKDMMFTLETVSCLGACGLAPVVVINEDVYGQMTPEKITAVIRQIKEKEMGNVS